MVFGYNLDKFNGLAVIIEKRPISTCIKAANRIMEGYFVLIKGLDEIPYDVDNVDWNIKDVRLNDSSQLFLQSLLPVQYLCIAYNAEHKAEYMDRALYLFHSWYAYESLNKDKKSNPYIWNDYAVSDRVCTIIYMLLLCLENDIENSYFDEMVDMLRRSAEWLYDEKNYFKNCNHGIMEDQTLIYLSKFLDDERTEEWLQRAKERLKGQVEFSFTDEMVHVENSPQYQETVLRILSKTAEFLAQFGDEYGKELYEGVKRSFEFMSWMIKPYGGLADIGDSDGNYKEPPFENKRMQIFEDEHLNYAAMLGHIGTKPEALYAYYPHSGYFINRSSWEKDELLNATWFMFKSGYHTRVHKHADDLSFMLVSKGYDIFIDSGKYGYKLGDPYVDYLHSALGHNTVVVNNQSYSISNERTHLAGLCEFKELPNTGYYVRGYNNAYDGVSIEREVFQWENSVVIHDMIEAQKEEIISQIFHMPSYIKMLKCEKDEVLFGLADSNWRVRIRQFSSMDSCDYYEKMTKDKTYAYTSLLINSISESRSLKFDKLMCAGEFITVITIEDAASEIEQVKLCDNELELGEHSIKLGKLETYSLDKLAINQEGKSLVITDRNDLPIEIYQYEIWDYKWKKKIREVETTDSETKLLLDFYGTTVLKANITTQKGVKIRSVVALIVYNPESNKFVIMKEETTPYNIPKVENIMEKMSHNKMRYTLSYKYFWDAKINWFMYKDGGCVWHYCGVNSITMDYEFQEPGQYAMMYYIESGDGEKKFYSFPEYQYTI